LHPAPEHRAHGLIERVFYGSSTAQVSSGGTLATYFFLLQESGKTRQGVLPDPAVEFIVGGHSKLLKFQPFSFQQHLQQRFIGEFQADPIKNNGRGSHRIIRRQSPAGKGGQG
jgi:hypothetical protein